MLHYGHFLNVTSHQQVTCSLPQNLAERSPPLGRGFVPDYDEIVVEVFVFRKSGWRWWKLAVTSDVGGGRCTLLMWRKGVAFI